MARSARRDTGGGIFDKVSGSLVKLSGRLTGNKRDRRRGPLIRTRGQARTGKGWLKRSAR